ncbi:hypothetical protein MTP03_02960 [Tsukamurella sp. PLM1]|nr:hypothetical protein MTP03_02960 [Tsukamurella sp. PLM1]
MLGDVGRQAHVDGAVGDGERETRAPQAPRGGDAGGVRLGRVGFDRDVDGAVLGERVLEVAGAAAHVEDDGAVEIAVQVAGQLDGVARQRAVEPGGLRLLEAEVGQQPHRAA